MRKILISALAALSLFASDMALAQNADNLDSNDVIQAIRRDSNGNGTRGSVPVTSVLDGVGVGYNSGSAVTQATSRTTGVTINAYSGAITLVSAAGSATAASFTVTNNKIAATDVVVLSQKSGTDLYNLEVTAVAAGSFRITFFTTGGTTTEQPVINFAIVRGKAS